MADGQQCPAARNGDAKPIGYAVQMEDGPFVGIWRDQAEAEAVRAKQPPSHNDKVIPVYAGAPVSETEQTEGYPGIAHDLETMRTALQKIAADYPRSTNEGAQAWAREALNAASTSPSAAAPQTAKGAKP